MGEASHLAYGITWACSPIHRYISILLDQGITGDIDIFIHIYIYIYVVSSNYNSRGPRGGGCDPTYMSKSHEADVVIDQIKICMQCIL